jgi:DNA-binding GntR family transcriptional regulator
VEFNWNSSFGRRLSRLERSIVNELREHRNNWAHQATFTDDDAYRVLDSAERLLRAIGADSEAKAAKALRLELNKSTNRFEGNSKEETKVNTTRDSTTS